MLQTLLAREFGKVEVLKGEEPHQKREKERGRILCDATLHEPFERVYIHVESSERKACND